MSAKFKYARPAAAAFGLVALLGALPAFAADAVMEQPPAPLPMEEVPVASWAGGYAGLQAGYGFSGRVTGGDEKVTTDGFVGGAFGGYNWQNGMFVYGVEGDVGYNGNRGDDNGVTTRGGMDGSLRARLGVAATNNVLIYGTAGGAATQMKVDDGFTSDDRTMLGFTAGVGTDIKLTEQVFARGEYRYTDYGGKDFNLTGGDTKVDARENKFLLGLGMKF